MGTYEKDFNHQKKKKEKQNVLMPLRLEVIKEN